MQETATVTRILSFGAGVDSTAIIVYHLYVRSLDIDHVVFADAGAEFPETYDNVELIKTLCEEAGIPFHIVKKGGETILEWCLRLGIVPVMAGGAHVCSQKFKGDVIQAWAKLNKFENPVYLIGIEADEGHRLRRFSPPKGSVSRYEYPLVDMGMNRAACEDLLKRYGFKVRKSSCMFCPFMSPAEIKETIADPKAKSMVQKVEKRFKNTSAEKHQAWIDAGMPLNKGDRAPVGMWRRNSWAEGQRLFVAKHAGRALSIEEWADLPNTSVQRAEQLCFQM